VSIPKRIPELDGLRGISILLVLAFHYIGVEQTHSFLGFISSYGWCGVDLFFVLSGFLIGRILIEQREATNYYQVFYSRRAFRILPLFLLCSLSVAFLVSARIADDCPRTVAAV
jgi:peptidoglycan/LPS O-acetylase OafA/YrhL